MKRLLTATLALFLVWTAGDATPPQNTAAKNKNIGAPSSGFPRTVQVRLWYLHPPAKLTLRAEARQAHWRHCATCAEAELGNVELRASGSNVAVDNAKNPLTEFQVSGAFQMRSGNEPPIPADFPINIRAAQGKLLITATMPMDEYVAGVLAGETGNFKSEEALKAMSVAARTYAMHFGSRHALDHFDLCDTTHCQDLRIAGIDGHLRKIAESTSGEILWYEGEPAATYYHANCGGTTEDAQYTLGNDEAKAPYLKQHSDVYCVRNGSLQWRSEVSKRELQRALADENINVPGVLRTVSVTERTPSGRVEFLRVTGSAGVTVPALSFRFAIGRHIGWERLKSNWYDVSVSGDQVSFHGRGSGHGVGLCQVGAEVMGEEGKTYRDILAYYYPGTKLGVAAQGASWHQLTGENIELITMHPETDQPLLTVAAKILREAAASTGLSFRATPTWKVFPTVAMFRDSTGEPGWVAATTRGRTIQTQPAQVLRQAGTLESTLKHELLHILVESNAKSGTPTWFREGLVLYLSEPNAPLEKIATFSSVDELEKAMLDPQNEKQLREAYADAHARVARLASRNGTQALLAWLQQGLPDAQ